MEKIFEREVSAKSEGKRLDQYLVASGIGLSRSQVQNLIKQGKVFVNGIPQKKPSYRIKRGDKIFLKYEIEEKKVIIAQDIPIPIIYEDEDIVVVDKPLGMVVHPAAGHFEGTLVNALLYRYGANLPQPDGKDGKIRPGIVHRLDKETTGLLVVAKNDMAIRSLAKQMEEKTAKRIYWAVVWGVLPKKQGKIEAPIGRHPVDRKKMTVTPFNSKYALTEYKVLETFDEIATLVEVELKTGRTHQIRVHFEYLGYPIIGDPTYSGRKINKIFKVVPSKYKQQVAKILEIIKRQALHAKKLSIIHPRTGKRVTFETDLPEDINSLLDFLRSKTKTSPQS